LNKEGNDTMHERRCVIPILTKEYRIASYHAMQFRFTVVTLEYVIRRNKTIGSQTKIVAVVEQGQLINVGRQRVKFQKLSFSRNAA